jgi:putative endonuclease
MHNARAANGKSNCMQAIGNRLPAVPLSVSQKKSAQFPIRGVWICPIRGSPDKGGLERALSASFQRNCHMCRHAREGGHPVVVPMTSRRDAAVLSSITMDKKPAVYILASDRNGTLYVGVTTNLVKRVWEHREGIADGFTKKYSIHKLVYFEQFNDMDNAITREKRLKKWRRSWKLKLIEENNPNWNDLWKQITT